MTKEEIASQIEGLKREQKAAKGTPTETYSRVVGYLRPVQVWNEGKKAEWDIRKKYAVTKRSKAACSNYMPGECAGGNPE